MVNYYFIINWYFIFYCFKFYPFNQVRGGTTSTIFVAFKQASSNMYVCMYVYATDHLSIYIIYEIIVVIILALA